MARNAIDVLQSGDTLTIHFSRKDTELQITVRDSGPGIPGDLLPHIFELFVTSGKSNGTGLGLAIVKRFVEEHQGTVKVESEPGQGTTFSIRLPQDED